MSVNTLIPKGKCMSASVSDDARSMVTDKSGNDLNPNGRMPSPAESARIRQNIIDGYDR